MILILRWNNQGHHLLRSETQVNYSPTSEYNTRANMALAINYLHNQLVRYIYKQCGLRPAQPCEDLDQLESDLDQFATF